MTALRSVRRASTIVEDESFSFETLRTAGFAGYGGADLEVALLSGKDVFVAPPIPVFCFCCGAAMSGGPGSGRRSPPSD